MYNKLLIKFIILILEDNEHKTTDNISNQKYRYCKYFSDQMYIPIIRTQSNYDDN